MKKMPQIPKELKGLKVLLNITRDPLAFFTNLMTRSGPFAWISIRNRPLLVLNDATGIQYVLETRAENFRKGRFHEFLRPIFGKSIFLSEGETWRAQRRAAAPVFANRNYEDWVTQMVAAAETMFRKWDVRIANNEPIDLALEMTGFTLDVLLRSLFHESRSGVAYDMRSTLDTILSDTEARVWSSFNLPPWIAHRLPKYQQARKFLHHLVGDLIKDRRENMAYPEDLLSTLIDHYDLEKNQSVLQDEVLAYLLSGHDTTAHGLAWAFYALVLHPEIYKRVEAEIAEILGAKKPTLGDLKNISYTRQVFDEVLRLYPPVWSVSREVAVDEEIPLDDGSKIFVPRGAGIMLCHYTVHRRPCYWPNPEAFDPERFAPEAVEKRKAFSWFPFGGGPRLCIGFRLAQLESLVALSMITQRYKLALVPGQHIVPKPIITLRPSGPIYFNVSKKEAFDGPIAQSQINVDIGKKCPFHKVA